MSDSISRAAAIDVLKHLPNDNPSYWHKCDVVDRQDAIDEIEMLPSAEPERKKGKWTHEDCHAMTYKYCCSNCKAHHRAMYDYCPSCGADMRGEQDG